MDLNASMLRDDMRAASERVRLARLRIVAAHRLHAACEQREYHTQTVRVADKRDRADATEYVYGAPFYRAEPIRDYAQTIRRINARASAYNFAHATA